jgi:protein-export membrane protein SecD
VLYFSKLKLVVIYFIIITISFFFITNFVNNNNNSFISKKINLGLDLQGGSYLLLEVDSTPIVKQNFQTKLILLRKYLKEQKIKYSDLKIKDAAITFKLQNKDNELFEEYFFNKDNQINSYFDQYKSFEMDFVLNNNIITISYSKFGLIEIKNNALEHSLEIVRRRIDEVGTKDPTIIRRGNDRILIELPGIDDPNRIKNLLGKTAQLEFRLVSEGDENFSSEMISFEDESAELKVNKRIIMSGDNLVNAQPSYDSSSNQTIVNFSLDRVGAKKFGRTTSKNIGKRLAIILDNKIISAPQIREAILSGNGQISGNFTFQSATDLALLLRSGSLPAPLNIIEERSVGPDLGEDSIKAGIISLALGFLLVILYMFYKYRFLGFIANSSLIINLILLVGLLTILEATLTLPGIAGIILTVGMAVDANVLVFERIKEEMVNVKSYIHAFDIGYKKSQTAILDANITTLISAIILFFLGSGPVKGFAVTLGIGILTTLFTTYFFARHLSSIYVMRNKDKTITL